MGIVDLHSHFFSAAFFRALAERSPLPGDPGDRLAAVARKTGIEIPVSDEDLLARWMAELDRHGVDHLCTFASGPEEVPVVCAAAAASRGRLSAFGWVDPRSAQTAADVRRLLASGAIRGVLAFPAMHHYLIGGPESKPLLEALSDHEAVIFVHCGLLVVKLRDLLGLPRPQDLSFANPLSVVPAANAFPRVRFVIPHFGAGFFRETLMAGSQCPNILVDTSSSNSWRRTQVPAPTLAQVLERSLEVFGPERILFGTDSNTFPAGWRADRWREQEEAAAAAGASTADREKIFGGNARRLLMLA